MRFPTRLLGDDETPVLACHPHVRRLAVPLLVLVVVVPAAAAGALAVPDGGYAAWLRGGVLLVAALVLLRFVLWPWLRWRTTLYAITDRRLITRTGVVNRSGHDMPLSRLNDVAFEHDLLERMLGCGTLVVESAGERGQLVLRDVPRVERVQRTLYRLSDELRGVGDDGGWDPGWDGGDPPAHRGPYDPTPRDGLDLGDGRR